jgi:hypothetical protein
MEISIHNNLKHVSLLTTIVYEILPPHFLMYSIIAIRLSHSTVETNSHGDAMSGDRPY